MGGGYTLLHASRLVAGLRQGSRTVAKLGSANGDWSRSELLGAALFNLAQSVAWAASNAGRAEHARTPRPEPVGPAQAVGGGRPQMGPDELLRRLGYKAVSEDGD